MKAKKKATKQKKPSKGLKRFIVKKFIMATSAHQALKLERRHRPDEVFIDDDWRKENSTLMVSAIGFNLDCEYDD